MARSRRKPFTYVTGLPSLGSHQEKKYAARRRRSAQKLWLRQLVDYDAALPPHPYECPANDVWGWRRDGRARLVGLHSPDGHRDDLYRAYRLKAKRK